MIDWKRFYANGGYNGENDPECYDNDVEEEDYIDYDDEFEYKED